MSGSLRAVDSLPTSGAYFRLIMRRFGRTPEQAARILEGTGIDPADAMTAGPDDAIDLGQLLRQIRNLAKIATPTWGLEIGQALDAAAHGTLGVAATSAPTLGDALDILERFAHVRAPFFRLDSKAAGTAYELRIEPQLPLEPAIWLPLVETLFLSLQALVESALGRPMSDCQFRADYPAPDHADRYAEFLHAPIAFGQPGSAVVLPRDWLPLHCPFADPARHQASIERLEQSVRHLQGEAFIVAQVERILEGAGDAGLELDQVASQLGLSRRTLVRRLGKCGASFRSLVDDHRRRRASELLADPQLTVTEAAYRLGYTEPANFGRACRRWFGTGPRAYRDRLAADRR